MHQDTVIDEKFRTTIQTVMISFYLANHLYTSKLYNYTGALYTFGEHDLILRLIYIYFQMDCQMDLLQMLFLQPKAVKIEKRFTCQNSTSVQKVTLTSVSQKKAIH